MSLERQDARTKLDPSDHAALVAICDVEGVTIAEFIERLLVPVIRKRIHDATVLAEKTAHLGISGKNREQPGTGRESSPRP